MPSNPDPFVSGIDLDSLVAALSGASETSASPRLARKRVVMELSRAGFSIARGPRIRGRALLHTRLRGVELVKRLKDAEGTLGAETCFWVQQLVEACQAEITAFGPELVTHPPSSGKRAHHLATEMAHEAARLLGIPYAALFVNPAPRGHRASLESKLAETGGYEYARGERLRRALVVDDIYCTGMTARRCVEAAGADGLFFLCLSRS